MSALAAVTVACGPGTPPEGGFAPLAPPPGGWTEADYDRAERDARKRGGRGDSPWKSSRFPQEPPAPPLMAHPCERFEVPDADLVEVAVANDLEPVPVQMLVPAAYMKDARAYAATDIEGVFLMKAWQHDFAPFHAARTFYSLAKKPNDHLTLLVRGGEGGPDDGPHEALERAKAFTIVKDGEKRSDVIWEPDGPAFSWDEEMGAYRADQTWEHSDYATMWAAFDEDGHLSDWIECRKGPRNQRCAHEMVLGNINPKVTYDDALVGKWRRMRSMTEEFFDCAKVAYNEHGTNDHVD